jgi:hypothetical protein
MNFFKFTIVLKPMRCDSLIYYPLLAECLMFVKAAGTGNAGSLDFPQAKRAQLPGLCPFLYAVDG